MSKGALKQHSVATLKKMGQFISILCSWFCQKKTTEAPTSHEYDHHLHHHHTNYQTFSSHYIDIPDQCSSTTENVENHDINTKNPSTPADIIVDWSCGYVEVNKKKRRKKKKKQPMSLDHGDDDQLVTQVVFEKSVTTSIKDHASVGKIGPYTSAQRILLVGEGDFSFSACLAKAFGSSANNIVATSLNSIKILTTNYAMFGNNKAELESRGSMVVHGVNATNMVKHHMLGSMVFDRIIFNFPHAGNFCNTEIRLHQNLISSFIRNAKEMLHENGEIHITLKSNGIYLEWDIPKLGRDQGLNLIQEVKFKRSKYPGYNPKYGYGGDRDFDCNPSKTYKFGLSQMNDNKIIIC